MVMRVVLFFLFVAVFLAGCGEERIGATETHPDHARPTEAGGLSSAIGQLYALINSAREKENLPLLLWSDELGELASAQAHDMCERGYFNHTNPEGDDPVERARAGCAGRFVCEPLFPETFLLIAENIAEGFENSEEVFFGWMNSPPHRANILDGRYTHIGIGTCGGRLQGHDGCGGHWVVLLGAASSEKRLKDSRREVLALTDGDS